MNLLKLKHYWRRIKVFQLLDKYQQKNSQDQMQRSLGVKTDAKPSPKLLVKWKQKKNSTRRKRTEVFLHWSAYIISIVAPLFIIPQIKLVWTGNTAGISILTWLFMLVKSGIFTAWGIDKKVRMLIFKEGLQTIMVSLVVIGLLLSS